MSKRTRSNINEEINSAGDGSGLALPPAFVVVQPRQHRAFKKNNKVDGRTSGAKALFSRIQKRKMKEEIETNVTEAVSTETDRAQKQIAQGKKLKRQKELQAKRKDAKTKMQDKTKEMDILMKARLSDFKKKASQQTKKLQKNEVEHTGDVIMNENQDVVKVALDVATSELNPNGEASFAKIQFADGGVQNLDNFSAKRIAATYAQLDDTHKQQFQYMLNKDAATYQSALDFAVRNN
tara:strand:+ start:189 stop:899 length:711 start_codon:yes stop_codon:yes gene_type:complete